jgi:hypothetical protein
VTTEFRRRTPGDRHFADQAVTSPTKLPISVFIHDEAINGRTNDGQQASSIQVFRSVSTRLGLDLVSHPVAINRPKRCS